MMRRVILVFLCIVLLTVTAVGCGNDEQSSGHTSAETPQAETPKETATDTPTPEETTTTPTQEVTATEEAVELTSPIEIDTSVPVEKGARIAVVAKDTDSGYWNNLKDNMQEAVDYLNQVYEYSGDDKITMTFEGPKDEEDVTDQINIIDAVLAENPAVLCLAAIDVNSCQAQLETAEENGIPVVIFDSGVTSELATTYVGTNNRKAGRKAADKLCEAIGDCGEVAVFAHENITETSLHRVAGFKKRIRKKHPDVILESINYENEEESTEDMIRKVLDEHEQLKGIFCTNGTMTETVLKVLADYPDRDVKVVGFDAGEVQKSAIMDGKEYGTIVQDTYRMAYETIWTAARYTGEEEIRPETEMLIPFVWVDQENIESEENIKILYD